MNSDRLGISSMPPVNSAPSSEVDNEATAELPVLDVAAYESSLKDEPMAHTDTWVMPSNSLKAAADATTEMPAIKSEAIPAYDLDHSGTHEMPQMLLAKPAKQAKPARASNKPGRARAEAVAPPVAAPPAASTLAPIEVPPSPPMIEE